jgi:putative acyl-CoA dehydrogenase
MFETHQVTNQAEPFAPDNLFSTDLALQEALAREAPALNQAENGQMQAQMQAKMQALGQQIAAAAKQDWARLANQNGPKLQNYNRQGQRIDEVEFHPAWHELMALMIKSGVHAAPWQAEAAGAAGQGAHVLRAAQYILFGQLENGAQCPVTMTFAAVPALKLAPALAQHWLPKLFSREYDPSSQPMEGKKGVLIGMGMTEKQGGSDVRSNSTLATPLVPGDAAGGLAAFGACYRLVGHKWFFSAPQADAHLVLAQTDPEFAKEGAIAGSAGLSCFFVPRYLPDGKRNGIVVQRLKDKLGNRSNASSEVEFHGAIGVLLGQIGRGIASIMEMGHHTRLDCVLGTAGIMRAALCHALNHARGRRAFGRTLAEQPLMQNVLADLALESEAATVFAMRLARCYDQAHDPQQAALARLLTPAGKYWLCKRGPTFGAEAMEVLGGNGYVEDGPLARLYREFPVNSIWEGSGNVMCLDLLRGLGRQSGTADVRAALAQELGLAAGLHPAQDEFVAGLFMQLAKGVNEFGARRLAEQIVLAVQGALLLRHAPAYVAQGFIASRIARQVAGAFGCLPDGVEVAAILQRALV